MGKKMPNIYISQLSQCRIFRKHAIKILYMNDKNQGGLELRIEPWQHKKKTG